MRDCLGEFGTKGMVQWKGIMLSFIFAMSVLDYFLAYTAVINGSEGGA